MGKQNIKVSSSSEFTGFAAFASHSSTAATAVQLRSRQQKQPPNNTNNNDSKSSSSSPSSSPPPPSSSIKPSPVYTGSNSTLLQIFKRIGQKKDALTKSRALTELRSYAYPTTTTTTSNTTSTPTPTTATIPKSDQITALSHFIFLLSTKLLHDNHGSVRRESMKVLGDAILHVPKAVRALVWGGSSGGGGSLSVVGWIYLFQSSQVADIRKIATMVWNRMLTLLGVSGNENTTNDRLTRIRETIASHAEVILQSSARPLNLANALSVVGPPPPSSKQQSQPTPPQGSGGGKKKGKQKQQGNNNNNNKSLSESEQDEMKERYERIVLLTLRGIEQLFRSYPETTNTTTDGASEDGVTTQYYESLYPNPSVLWKHLSSTRSSFRRATYGVITSVCHNAVSILHSPPPGTTTLTTTTTTKPKQPHDLSNLVLNAVSSERDPANYPFLFEMILSYISSFTKLGAGGGGTALAWDTTIGGNTTTTATRGMDAKKLVKGLSKILRKACYGSPAAQWGPSILPMIASLPRGGDGGDDEQIQLQLLTSLWSGRSAAIGLADTAILLSAVAESASFLLRRKIINTPTNNNEPTPNTSTTTEQQQLANDYAQIFLDVLSYTLTTPTYGTVSSSTVAEGDLLQTVSRELHQLDTTMMRNTTTVGNGCLFGKVEEWFWGEGLRSIIVLGGGDLSVPALSLFLTEVVKFVSGSSRSVVGGVVGGGGVCVGLSVGDGTAAVVASHVSPIFKSIFHQILHKTGGCGTGSNTDQGVVPTGDEASILLSILEFCGVDYVFDEDNEDGAVVVVEDDDRISIETFCTRDLLRWICCLISNTADGSTTKNTIKTIRTYFQIVSILLTYIVKTNNGDDTEGIRVFRVILDAIMAPNDDKRHNNNNSDLGTLANGLVVLGIDHADLIRRSAALEPFAIMLGDAVASSFLSHHHDAGEFMGDDDDDDAGGETPITTDYAADGRGYLRQEGLILFLRTCTGLLPNRPSSMMLVGPTVIQSYLQQITIIESSILPHARIHTHHRSNILLEILLSFVFCANNNNTLSSSSSLVLGWEEKMELALAAWRQGGTTWKSEEVETLFSSRNEEEEEDRSFKDDLISSALQELKKDLSVVGTKKNVSDEDLDHDAFVWSQRAWRILQLSNVAQKSPNTNPQQATMNVLGLDNKSLWKSAFIADTANNECCSHSSSSSSSNNSSSPSCDALYLRLMYLLQNTEQGPERINMIIGSNGTSTTTEQQPTLDVGIIISILTTFTKYDHQSKSSSQQQQQCCDDEVMLSRCQYFFDYLGVGGSGSDTMTMSSELIEACCYEAIEVLATSMQHYSNKNNESSSDNGTIERGVVVLDWLVGLLCDEKLIASSDSSVVLLDDVTPQDVKEGDTLWYITDGTVNDSPRVKATIMKIHTDDFPNLYFTIEAYGDGTNNDDNDKSSEVIVRQTVAQRLKTRQFPAGVESASSSSLLPSPVIESNVVGIRRTEEAIVIRLVKPYLLRGAGDNNDRCLTEAASELLNTVISRCGLKGRSGIGTNRFDVFQLINGFGEECCELLLGSLIDNEEGDDDDDEEAIMEQLSSKLTLLSLALGYGCLTKRSSNNCTIMKFDCCTLMSSMLHFFQAKNFNGGSNHHLTARFYQSVMMWLSISVDNAMNDDNVAGVWFLMELITTALVSDKGHVSVVDVDPSIWLLRSLTVFHSIQTKMITLSGNNKATYIASEQDAISNLLGLFVRCGHSNMRHVLVGSHFTSKSDGGIAMSYDHYEQAWIAPFKTFVIRNIKEDEAALAHAAKTHVEDLCINLSSLEKQWCAFQILTFLAQKKQELYSGDDVFPPDDTCSRLDGIWKHGLADQDASELEQDVLATAKWLPHHLMSCIEGWDEKGMLTDDEEKRFEDNDSGGSAAGIISFLKWLLCLDFLDAAAACDMRNRSHISSYIEKTGAVKKVFELALESTTLQNQRYRGDWFSCTSLAKNNSNDNCKNDGMSSLVQISTLAIFRTVESMPTLCKSWWSDYCPRSLQPAVTKFVESSVAPETLRRELTRINAANNLGELIVSGSCVSREVTATYIQDECKLSVLISIPASFPLRNVRVDCEKSLGINEKRWRHWSLQIMQMLNSQDGSVLDALLLWKQNVDKEFEGIEPCPVCYSVLCVKTHAMPNLECKTCSNRFHSSCLYKWFSSSGKNSCVICQQPWSGFKVA